MADLHRKGHPTDKLIEVSRRLRNLEIGTTGRQRKYGEMIVSGTFDITLGYGVGQVVEYEGATYVVSPTAPGPPPAGTLPTDATYWMPVGSQAGVGPQGPPGPMGPPGSGNNWIFRGPWQAGTLYASGDVVNHDPADARRTSSYVATRATQGDPPDSSPADWYLLAEGGVDGTATGPEGPPGPQGEPGPAGPAGPIGGGVETLTWVPLPFEEGWENATSPPNQPCEYAVEVDGTVWMRGVALSDGSDSLIAVLPPEARPPFAHYFNAGIGRGRVTGDGYGAGAGYVVGVGTQVSLDTAWKASSSPGGGESGFDTTDFEESGWDASRHFAYELAGDTLVFTGCRTKPASAAYNAVDVMGTTHKLLCYLGTLGRTLATEGAVVGGLVTLSEDGGTATAHSPVYVWNATLAGVPAAFLSTDHTPQADSLAEVELCLTDVAFELAP